MDSLSRASALPTPSPAAHGVSSILRVVGRLSALSVAVVAATALVTLLVVDRGLSALTSLDDDLDMDE